MSQDPLRTPSETETTEDDDLLRELHASLRADNSRAFGSTPNGLPAMNAGPTFGWGNNAVPPSNQPEGVSMPPGAVPTNMVAQVTKLIPTIKVNDNDIWNANPDELYDMLFRWTLSLARYELSYATMMVQRHFPNCTEPVQRV